MPGSVNVCVRFVLCAVCTYFRCEAHFKQFLPCVMSSVDYFILNELEVQIFCHRIHVFADLGPGVGIESIGKVLFPFV